MSAPLFSYYVLIQQVDSFGLFFSLILNFSTVAKVSKFTIIMNFQTQLEEVGVANRLAIRV